MYQTQDNTTIQPVSGENNEFFKNYFFPKNLAFSSAGGYTNGDYQLRVANNVYYLFNASANTIALIIDGVSEQQAINLANLYLSNPV